MELTLYTRADCHLCEEAKSALQPLLQEFDVDLREVDIDADPQLRARFNEEVPVVFVNDRKVAKYRVDAKQLRRLLERKTR